MDCEKLAIYLNYGEKGSGKSYLQAKDALNLFKDYRWIEKRYPFLPKRIYFGNQRFSKEIEEKELGNHLFYWNSAKQLRWCPRVVCWKGEGLHPVHDADIAHDEISKDLPAGSWADTPKWFRQIFSHLRKRGNRYFANTQVYEDIDISFRRQIDFAFKIEKIWGSGDITATRPKPRFIWGIILRRSFNPQLLEWERNPETREEISASYLPGIHFIVKKVIKAYDTTDEIPAFKPDTLEHVELWCENPDCEKHGKNTGKPRTEHYKI